MNKNAIRQVYAGKSRKKAVQLMCHECVGYNKHRGENGNVTYGEASTRIKQCPSKKCPLWPYRLPKTSFVEPDWL